MNASLLSRAVDRRNFIKFTGLATGGFALAFYIRSGSDAVAATTATLASADFTPNAFIRITGAGKITIVSKQPEMGQGVKTSLPMIIAEQLEVPFNDITIEQGDFDLAKFGNQGAGGSNSTPNNYDNFHLVGATARTMLVKPPLRLGVSRQANAAPRTPR